MDQLEELKRIKKTNESLRRAVFRFHTGPTHSEDVASGRRPRYAGQYDCIDLVWRRFGVSERVLAGSLGSIAVMFQSPETMRIVWSRTISNWLGCTGVTVIAGLQLCLAMKDGS